MEDQEIYIHRSFIITEYSLIELFVLQTYIWPIIVKIDIDIIW